MPFSVWRKQAGSRTAYIRSGWGKIRYASERADGSEEWTVAVSEEQKKKIDEWLRTAGRNEYGDPKGTVYAGGNPLFNEWGPDPKDRYEYILEKNPQLRGK